MKMQIGHQLLHIKNSFCCNLISLMNSNIEDLNVNFGWSKLTKLTTPVAEATVSIHPERPQLHLNR